LITPKGFLWSGEDNTSPQIKQVTGKNVDDYAVLFYWGYCHRIRGWFACFFLIRGI